MPTIPNGYAQANLRFTGTNVPTGAEVVIGVDPTDTDPLDVATSIATAFGTADWVSLYVDDMTMSSILVKMGPNSTGASGEQTFDFSGDSTSAAVHPNTAMLFRKITASGGRAGRGRMYFPGIPENVIDTAGFIDAGFVDSMQSVADDFGANLVAEGVPMVVLHSPGSPLSTPTPVTGFVASSQCATQRKRMRR